MTEDEWAEPNCIGKWFLFDSTYWSDHLEAKELCDTCPARKCRPIMQHILRDPLQRTMLEGTWDGVLYDETSNRRLKRGEGKSRQHGKGKKGSGPKLRD